jgi:polyribonucleotide nucleotidyltransferase
LIHEVSIDVGGQTLRIETGRMARLAAGAALVRFGETMVLSAASISNPREGTDFFPLTIDYREKNYAAGKIPGGFHKREGAPSVKEILTMRMADRPIRPLWPEGYRNDVQVQSFVLSYDQLNDPDVLSIIGAGAALSLANAPFLGPVGAVRVGMAGDEYVAFPDNTVLAQSPLDMVVAGTAHAVTMVEGGAKELSEAQILGAIEFGHEAIQKICAAIEDLRRKAGWKKPHFESPKANEAAAKAVSSRFGETYRKALHTPDKLSRVAAVDVVKKEIVAALADAENPEHPAAGRFSPDDVKEAIETLHHVEVREAALNNKRVDGRRSDEIRPIDIEVGLLPRAHGSALFTRGETQVLCAATLGTGLDEKLEDGLHATPFSRKYYLHYNFPPFCVGETRPIRGPGRREIGHGNLAERALLAVLPPMEEFPYTLRIVSDVLMSNGSSSMGTVCGTTLAMMDAGIKIQRPVAGIAMGLVQEGDRIAILSDILGDEDHSGDMDFKVAGSQKGVTAIQMDIKMTGVSPAILRRALEQARDGRIHILQKMLAALPRPRDDYHPFAPRVETVRINPEKIGALIGPGGKNIRRIQEESGATIEVDDDGLVKIFATQGESAKAARAQVEAVTQEATLGKIYDGKVTSVKDFGAFLEIIPGIEGLCHVSELSDGFVGRVTDVVRVGDIVPVKVILIDDSGRVKLSRRQALVELGRAEEAKAPAPSDVRPEADEGDEGPPREFGHAGHGDSRGDGRGRGGRHDRGPRRDHGGGRGPRR